MARIRTLLSCAVFASLATLGSSMTQNRIFTIGIFASLEPYGYIDAKGDFVGMALDTARGICAAAGADCAIVHAPVGHCWSSADNTAGPTLMGGQIDACFPFKETKQRKWSLDYSTPVFASRNVEFWSKATGGVSLPMAGATAYKIGFLASGPWYGKEFLNARTQLVTPGATYTEQTFPDVAAIFAALEAGTIDGYLGYAPTDLSLYPNVKSVSGEVLDPDTGFGSGFLLRKDNVEAKQMLNHGIQRYMASGQYHADTAKYNVDYLIFKGGKV